MALRERASKSPGKLKSIPTVNGSSPSTGLPFSDMETSPLWIGLPLNELICPAAGSPAKIYHVQENSEALEKAQEAVSGLNTLKPFAFYDHDISWWRTYQVSLITMHLDEFSETWPRAGTMRSGIVSQQQPLVSLMSEIGSGYLPTPQASDGTFLMIDRPNGCQLYKQSYRHLSNQNIDGAAKLADIAWKVWGGPLNPTYLEAMMGYPLNWTRLESMPSATPSSRRSRKR